ncbi:MAG: GDSL-type esterase/lipase family protein [Eubacteriales bacterium]|nr:GDSL-type esterase/lipase family protein [Eubacteriales bacterium]
MKRLLAMFLVVAMTISALGMVSFAAVANENVFNGLVSTKIVCTKTDGFTYFSGGNVQLEANTDYTLTFWAKGNGNPSVRVLNTTWSTSIVNLGFTGGSAWKQYTKTFNSGDYTTGIIALANNPYGNAGTMYVDDVCLYKTSDATATNLVVDPGFEGVTGTKWAFDNSKYSTMFIREISEVVMVNGVASEEAKTVSSIAVSGQKTSYTAGDAFVAPTVTVTYSDGTSEVVTSATFSGYNMANTGTQTVTVSYGGKTTTYTITIAPGTTPDPDPDPDPDPTVPDDNENVYEGNYAAKITSRGTDKFSFFTSKPITLEANTDYIISAWSKGGGSPSMRILEATSWSQVKDKGLAGGGIWQKAEDTFNSGSNKSVLFALCNNPYGGGGVMYVDNLFLAKKSEPTVNLVTDPNFELGTGWSFKETDTIFTKEYSKIAQDPDETTYTYVENEIDQPNGSSARKLYAGHDSVIYVPSGTVETLSQEVTLEASKEYRASFWVRSPGGGKINFKVKDPSGQDVFTYTVTGTNSWVRHLPLYITNTTAGKYKFCFESIASETEEIYIDYAMTFTKKRIEGTKLIQLISDYSFEGEGSWTGITGVYENGDRGFTLHTVNTGVVCDVSGGIRVMPVGDSITEGVGATNMVGGYKKALYDKYESNGVNVNFVGPKAIGAPYYDAGSGHAGYPGWTVSQIRNDIGNWMSIYEPQAILLMIGTNDILQDKPGTNTLAADAPGKLQETMDIIMNTNPNVKLIVGSVPPLDNSGNNIKVQTYNAAIKPMVEAMGVKYNGNVTFVDIYSAFPSKSDGIGNDYTHPDDKGYQYITDKWYAETKDIVTSLTPSSFESTKGTAYDGKYSLKYNPWYVSYYTLLTYEMYTRGMITVEPNTDYTFSMMVKGDQGVSLQTRLQTTFSGGVIKTLTTSAGPRWKKASVTFNSGDNTGILIAMINGCMSTGVMYVDCVELVNNTTGENLLSNSSFELDAAGDRTGWGNPKTPWSFVEDTTDVPRSVVSITKNGQPVTELKAGQIDISADLTGVVDDGAVMVVVHYEGNVVKNIVACEKRVDLATSITLDEVKENTSLKVMLLNNDSDIEPILTQVISR